MLRFHRYVWESLSTRLYSLLTCLQKKASVRVQLHWSTVELACQDLPASALPRSWPAKSFLSQGHSKFPTKLLALIDHANTPQAATFEQEDSTSSSNPTYALCKKLLRSFRLPYLTSYSYELLQWEEHQLRKRNEPVKRELEWQTVTREIALLNKPYSRS